MTTLKIQIPPKLIPVFAPAKLRYRGAYGGRGSAKTYTFAKMIAIRGAMYAANGERGILLCAREYMNSLSESSMEEIKYAIQSEPWLSIVYEVGEKYIRTKCGSIDFAFAGLRHNLDSIKSKARILIAWIDEAEPVSDIAWKKLLPTVRADDSEVWITWNPENEGSPTDVRFRKTDLGADGVVVEINHSDNPWLPDVLELERQRDQRNLPPEEYAWIWEGAYRQLSEAQIFRGKYAIEEFTPDNDWDGPYYGLDFGFANDPTAAVKLWIHDKRLYVEHEAYKVGLEIDDTAAYVGKHVPGIERHTVRADNARPETISYLKRKGLPRIKPCEKGKGSVEDGIEFIRSFDKVIIHPRCTNTAKEFRMYSYKTDRHTEDILPVPIDDYNHAIDAMRYALEPAMKRRGLNLSPDVLT
ncbi:PBSX family phage terminase large subunit [Methylobacillus sp.]|uniref:PBSX family phage terminase large subunit n=1 Tax=Methylobacillus sp. TaxID=56818 RepID=UPI002FDF8F1A